MRKEGRRSEKKGEREEGGKWVLTSCNQQTELRTVLFLDEHRKAPQ